MRKSDYPTCHCTYATLRIYHESARPAVVSRSLGIRPSSVQMKGQPWKRYGTSRVYPISGWFLTSKSQLESYDSTKHILWLLTKVEKKKTRLERLKATGWWMDISVYWDSAWGHGGPTLSPNLLTVLAKLNIEIWFDIYFSGAMDWTEIVKRSCATDGKNP
jgi:hypothetical protein